MARQPAVDIGTFLLVAFQTRSHAPVLDRQTLQIFNRTVAFLAGDLFVNMTLMVEQNVLGHVVYLCPGRRCLRVKIFMLFLNFGVVFYDVIVTVQTFFHRRDTRKIRVCDIGVAILALNLFDSDMNIVTEGYGLFGPESGQWRGPEIDHKCPYREYRSEC